MEIQHKKGNVWGTCWGRIIYAPQRKSQRGWVHLGTPTPLKKKKKAGRCHLPPPPPSINMQLPAGISTVPIFTTWPAIPSSNLYTLVDLPFPVSLGVVGPLINKTRANLAKTISPDPHVWGAYSRWQWQQWRLQILQKLEAFIIKTIHLPMQPRSQQQWQQFSICKHTPC